MSKCQHHSLLEILFFQIPEKRANDTTICRLKAEITKIAQETAPGIIRGLDAKHIIKLDDEEQIEGEGSL